MRARPAERLVRLTCACGRERSSSRLMADQPAQNFSLPLLSLRRQMLSLWSKQPRAHRLHVIPRVVLLVYVCVTATRDRTAL